MGLLRNRGGGGDDTGEAPPGVYRMREKMIAIGDDFWIENGAGQKAFKVNGKAMRIRDTLIFEDTDGHELLKIQERKLSVRDKMAIERGGEYDVKGNIVDHEYTFERDGREVASVSKRWFRVRDTYGVEVAPGEDDILVLAATVAIDQMTHDRA